MTQRQEAASRMAFAAYMHDLGKLAERARIDVKQSDMDTHKQQYCPNFNGRWTHVHAAYTALALDKLEPYLPNLKGVDFAPFANALSREADNSLVNAAARHHKPETFLQWIIATADRVASGFEREAFDKYNQAEDKTETGHNHYQARQLSLLEQIQLETENNKKKEISPANLKYRMPLRPLTPANLFPQLRETCEGKDDKKAQAEYLTLWHGLLQDVAKIPPSHRQQWALWLDHFDSLWQIYTHTIPAATAGNTKPDVSLYDHSRTTAALAVGLWRYHEELGHNPQDVKAKLSHKERPDWDEQKLLLIQGDFFGIQSFIFANGGESGKQAAKLLRGRSFYVSLLAECAALKILDTLELPPTSLVLNAAGKFLIVAANTDNTKNKLQSVQKEMNAWFLEYTYGQSSLGVAWLPASCNDFVVKKEDNSGFKQLMKSLFEQLEKSKLSAFALCNTQSKSPVFEKYINSFNNDFGVCSLNGYAPATHKNKNGIAVCDLSADQIKIGECLAIRHFQRLIISKQALGNSDKALKLPIFGYSLRFAGDDESSGQFAKQAQDGSVRRLIDISFGQKMDDINWHGYAKRAISSHVPVFSSQDKTISDRYPADEQQFAIGDIKTFNHLACENKTLDAQQKWRGIAALGVLKGDVDNLGAIFQQGQDKPTFAKMAALSRQMNAFFAVYLPTLCQTEFTNVYTVFAGGDDFFLMGPWYDLMHLASRMQQEFSRYCAHNSELHFSAGLILTKAGNPINLLANQAEDALEEAKHLDGKNAIYCLNQSNKWPKFSKILEACKDLKDYQEEYKLSTAFLYALLQWSDMVMLEKTHPQAALWRSQVAYRCFRHIQTQHKFDKSTTLSKSQALASMIGKYLHHDNLGEAYRLAVTTHLYRYRNTQA
ncbi:MAG: type III-A CRISPR-associated protein Cas10/Csm1 [Moraxellaceae bacterium]|nr:type III-A CRISPR-associated protein Cas10/Csm1 [Pseudomonadales bacterium]MCP5175161.1 type III-A CRISPR-associated protein Cas10/Csm1 [Moraxellaceae bacterium]MCP5177345.1 type III-A CRISPR-associated protein Cas10/Csm1 [Moraxellaceae bacterium]